MITTLKVLRIKKQKTLEQCAKDTGICKRTLIRYENGSPIGNSNYLKLLSEYYDVSMETLLRAASTIKEEKPEK